jgi:5-methylcytosine-specific restriction endonuclease McrA
MDRRELNEICKQVELLYRKENNRHNVRLRQINPSVIRRILLKYEIGGVQCPYCLTKRDRQRYCCSEHSRYYISITDRFYGVSRPLDYEKLRRTRWGSEESKVICPSCNVKLWYREMSVDHIVPITKGGLEFDRENLRWMCLTCNIKKSNKTHDDICMRTAAIVSSIAQESKQEHPMSD